MVPNLQRHCDQVSGWEIALACSAITRHTLRIMTPHSWRTPAEWKDWSAAVRHDVPALIASTISSTGRTLHGRSDSVGSISPATFVDRGERLRSMLLCPIYIRP